MVDMDNDQDIVSTFIHDPEQKLLLASTIGNGFIVPQSEITANTRAIGLQEASARRLEVHSQRDSYFKLHELVQDQLGAIAGFHFMSIAGPTGSGKISGEVYVVWGNEVQVAQRPTLRDAFVNPKGAQKWEVEDLHSSMAEHYDDNYMPVWGGFSVPPV